MCDQHIVLPKMKHLRFLIKLSCVGLYSTLPIELRVRERHG